MPVGSIVLQFNEWRIGDSYTALSQIVERNRYAEKQVYYLAPTGEIGQIYVKGGLIGVTFNVFTAEKSQAQEWLEQLDEWK